LFGTDGNMEEALPTCGTIDDPTNSRECYTGVFMEESFKTILADHGLAEIPVRDKARMERQTQRCMRFSDIAGQACWIDMAEIFQEYYNNDAKTVYESCNMAPEQQAKTHCYLKAAILMAIAPNLNSKDRLVTVCAPYEQDNNKDLYKKCTNFMISALMHYSSKYTDRGVALCSNISDEFREYCFRDLGEQLKSSVPSTSERLNLCSGTPSKYLKLCAQS
ncbi:MAG: hypothetical protein WD988_01390, partial [Candidatus Curtissbacteria bacterium]